MLQLKEEPALTQHIFYLAKQNENTKCMPIQYDFAPIKCRQTYKILRTIPTYQPDNNVAFGTQAQPLSKSLNLIKYQKNSQSCILIAKPSHNYCQVCKEEYEDYLKHITHPLHKSKIQQTQKSFSLSSIKSILEKQQKKAKKLTWNFDSQNSDRPSSQDGPQSMQMMEQSDNKSTGSKKRFIQRQTGSIELISVASSTNLDDIQAQIQLKPRRAQRKYSNFRQIQLLDQY